MLKHTTSYYLMSIVAVILGKWICQEITGKLPEPCSECTLTYIGRDKALLLGGLEKDGKVKRGFMDSVKILDLQNWVGIFLTVFADRSTIMFISNRIGSHWHAGHVRMLFLSIAMDTAPSVFMKYKTDHMTL